MSACSGSQARHAQDPPELGRAVVVNITPSPNSSEMGLIPPEGNDESSMSGSSLGTVLYPDVHASANVNTQFFQTGSSEEDISHTPSEDIDDGVVGADSCVVVSEAQPDCPTPEFWSQLRDIQLFGFLALAGG